jgi:cysteinyl-tRNA synthetase
MDEQKIKIYNTLTRKKEEFEPIDNSEVKIYTCGPTVYNNAHIGNLRSYIFADLLKRTLIMAGYNVRHAMNITDVDDKTIRNSIQQNKSLKEFTREYEENFMKDLESLRVLPSDYYPRATDYIEEMVGMIEKMIEEGYAYKATDGIYFKISSFDRYPELAMLDESNLKPGASERVASDEYDKESPNDFALWKYHTEEDGNVYWETSIGKGRPGWHIECSAMSIALLGEHIDIHTGGIDLIFPHHTNEIAQSESICQSCKEQGKRFVKYWMHNEHLLVDGKRMAKRYNNFYTLSDLTAKGYSARAVRYLLSAGHYRQQLNFTFESLDRAEREVQRISDLVMRLKERDEKQQAGKERIDTKPYEERFKKEMFDDISVTRALFVLNEFMTETNIRIEKLSRESLNECISFLNIANSIFEFIDDEYEKLTGEEESRIAEREMYREQKKYNEADAIREELAKAGIEIRDTKEGTIWRKRTKAIKEESKKP